MNETNNGHQPGPGPPDWESKVPEPVTCRRCGKESSAAEQLCPYCGARLPGGPAGPARVSRHRAEAGVPLIRLIWIFCAVLLVSLIYGWIVHFGFKDEVRLDWATRQRALFRQLTAEGADTILVVVAIFWVGRPPALPRVSRKGQLAAWLLAVPVLAVLLAANFGYAWLLRNILLLPLRETRLGADGLIGWMVLAHCAQPAIVEELFNRYLALGVLRTVTGTHGAILISSIMFGVAHIFNPLSIPMLIAIGMALGYLRVMSGGLLLPILMHFGHNGFIILTELVS